MCRKKKVVTTFVSMLILLDISTKIEFFHKFKYLYPISLNGD